MGENNIINPTPSEIKSDETQSSEPKINSQQLIHLNVHQGGLEQLSLAHSLQQIGNSESSKYKTQFLLMAAAWVNDVNARHEQTSTLLAKIEAREDFTNAELTAVKVENASLKARASADNSYKPLVRIAWFAGPIILGISLDEFRSSNWGVAITLLLVGTLMLVAIYQVDRKGESNE